MTVRAIVSLLAVTLLATTTAHAGELTKEECVDAHARGQDARDANKLSLARKLFLSCAQASCPALVQGDCARFVEDLTRQQPTVSFAARDAAGADLPDTTVYVDDALVATRLDDGRAYDIDPGPRAIKFIHDGVTRTTTIVINNGEKGRTVLVSFPGGATSAAGRNDRGDAPARSRGPTVHHPTGAKVLMIAGAALLVGGGAFGIYEVTRVPDECSFLDRTCLGTPGSQTFDDASSAAKGANLGFAIGGAGAAALIGGIIWYVTGRSEERASSMAALPWVDASGVGVALTGRL